MDTLFSTALGDVVRAAPYINAGAPTSGTSGTFANIAQKGDLLVDSTNGNFYINTNTSASPTWTAIPNANASAQFAFVSGSYATGLTAVGTTRANALVLTASTNHVATVASSAVGVVLPPSATVGVGGLVLVINDQATNSMHVYAAGSDTIDGTAGSTGVTLAASSQAEYQVNAAGAFISYKYAVTRSS